jgi:hypothetical protein
MRLFSRLLLAPSSRGDGTDDRLTAGMDVDMLHRDLLLPLAAITLERLDLSSEGAQQLYCEAPIPVPLEERLRILEAAKRRDAGGMRRFCVASIPSVSFDAPSRARLRFKAVMRSMTGGGAVISLGLTVKPLHLGFD